MEHATAAPSATPCQNDPTYSESHPYACTTDRWSRTRTDARCDHARTVEHHTLDLCAVERRAACARTRQARRRTDDRTSARRPGSDGNRDSAVYAANSRGAATLGRCRRLRQDVGADIWQFSVELSALRRAGLTTNECRWLVAKGLARHAREVTAADSDRRSFQNYANLALSKRTCFVIADRGVAYANALFRATPRRRASDSRDSTAVNRRRPAPESNGHTATLTPIWDSDRQQLRVGRMIVKEFKVPAANQEAILAAFQEEGWVPRIDDPLAPQLNQDSKRRLHDTINSLNRNQKHALIRFLGDGKGEGIRWEFAHDPPTAEEPRTK